MGFVLSTLPALYKGLRLPVFAVLAYGMTNVDMAMILGPTLPPSLAVQITDWMGAPSLQHLSTAAAGALVQLALVAATLAFWLGAERVLAPLIPVLAAAGQRARALDVPMAALARVVAGLIAFGLFAGMAGLALWSFAGLWQFPDALPESLSLKTWTKAAPDLAQQSATTLAIALAASLGALALALAALEAEARHGRPIGATWLIYLPLIMPQVAFLPGLQVMALHLGAKGSAATVAAAHLCAALCLAFAGARLSRLGRAHRPDRCRNGHNACPYFLAPKAAHAAGPPLDRAGRRGGGVGRPIPAHLDAGRGAGGNADDRGRRAVLGR
jgi:putative thiamine transport system permease protein